MSERNDGGPAFPQMWGLHAADIPLDRYAAHTESLGGMSLRDYFAAHAPAIPDWFVRLTAPVDEPIIDSRGMGFYSYRNYDYAETPEQHYIRWAWHYADAMIAERGKP